MSNHVQLSIYVLAGFLTAAAWTVPAVALDPGKSLDQLVHKSWTTEDGLPQNSVNDILQTRDGFLWIATFGGVARFDGQKFTVFDLATSPGLRSNRITALYEDPDGVLWLGGERGSVCRRDEGDFHCLGVDDGLPEGIVWSLARGPEGALWIATSRYLARLGNGEVRLFSGDDGLGASFDGLTVDREGGLWVGTSGGVARWGGRGFEYHRVAALPRDVTPRALASQENVLWLATREGLIRLDAGRADVLVEAPAEPGDGDILFDRDGHLWFVNRGVGRLRAPDFADDGERTLSDLSPLALYEDRDGNLWVGTNNGGLHLLRDGLFSSFLHPMSAPAAGIREMANGAVVFGTLCRGPYRLDDDRMTELAVPSQNLGCASAVLEDRHGRLFIGAHGLWIRDASGWTGPLDAGGALAATQIWALFEARDDSVWIGSDRGLARYAAGGVRNFTARDGVSLGVVRFITEDRRGNLWVAGPDGVIRFANGAVRPDAARHFTVADGLPHDSPLVTIQGFTGFLVESARAGDVERVEQDAARIRSAADKMSKLLHDLLELSRIGRLMNTPRWTPLTDAAREAAELVAGRLAEGGVTVEIDPHLPRVLVDRPRFVEVFQNLLDNAARFMGDQIDPRIVIGQRGDGSPPAVFVRDNGIGIAPQYHERVFDLFERLDGATEGTGIGLAIVKRIIEFHGGQIWVESKGPRRGTTFCFTLPAEIVRPEEWKT